MPRFVSLGVTLVVALGCAAQTPRVESTGGARARLGARSVTSEAAATGPRVLVTFDIAQLDAIGIEREQSAPTAGCMPAEEPMRVMRRGDDGIWRADGRVPAARADAMVAAIGRLWALAGRPDEDVFESAECAPAEARGARLGVTPFIGGARFATLWLGPDDGCTSELHVDFANPPASPSESARRVGSELRTPFDWAAARVLDRQVADFDATAVRALRVVSSGRVELAFERDAPQAAWVQLTSSRRRPAITAAAVGSFLHGLARMRARDFAPEGVSRQAAGITPTSPGVELVLADGSQHTIAVGDVAGSAASARYVAYDEEPTLFVVEADALVLVEGARRRRVPRAGESE